MPFATDRHLLILEPTLFRDVQFRSQRLVAGTVTITGNLLTFTSQDCGLIAAGVVAGHVVAVGGVGSAGDNSYEVVERISDSELTISRLRERTTDAVIPPAETGGVAAYISTFRPQLAFAHADLLARAQIEDELQVQNPEDLAPLEAALTLEQIYLACPSPISDRADRFRRLAEKLATRAAIHLDTNTDGQTDATRRLSPNNLSRA